MGAETDQDSKAIVKKTLASIGEIATLPEVTVKIIDIVEDPNGTTHRLHDVIKRDPTLSAKLLKVANSAFYGLPGQIANVDRAIVILGLTAVKNIAVAASLGKMFKAQAHPTLFDAQGLWKHCSAVAVAAKRIAQATGSAVTLDEIFLAGLLHDLGLIVEQQAFPVELAEVCQRCRDGEGDFLQLEQEVIGATHQDFGHALTTKWRFPQNLQAGVSAHHNPDILPDELREVAWILRCADILCCQEQLGFELLASGQALTQELLDATGLTADQLNRIREGLSQETTEAESALA